MAIPSEMDAVRRAAELCKTEQSADPQNSSRDAPQSGAAQAAGALAGLAADPSGDDGRDLNGAEAQAALDVEAAFGPFLDELVTATIRLSEAQRQIDRRRVGAWRPFLSALGERLWRPESKNAGSHQ